MSGEAFKLREKVRQNVSIPAFRSLGATAYGALNRWYNRTFHYDLVPDPYRIIYIDPSNVDQMLLESPHTDWRFREERPDDVRDLFDLERAAFRPERNVGRILDGNWDRRTKPIEENITYASLKAHFVEGVPWKETELVRVCLERIERGYKSYGYSEREEFLNERLSYLEWLYRNIEKNGYYTQNESPDDHRNEGILHEIGINIGKTGDLIFNNLSGNNRLAIARILGLEKIPVIVIVRHRQWCELKTRIDRDGHSDLSDEIDQEIDPESHPDIQNSG